MCFIEARSAHCQISCKETTAHLMAIKCYAMLAKCCANTVLSVYTPLDNMLSLNSTSTRCYSPHYWFQRSSRISLARLGSVLGAPRSNCTQTKSSSTHQAKSLVLPESTAKALTGSSSVRTSLTAGKARLQSSLEDWERERVWWGLQWSCNFSALQVTV